MQNRVSINIKNHIADVKLNRPEKMNALDEAMFIAIKPKVILNVVPQRNDVN